MKKYAYLTLFTKNKKGKYEFLIGFKKFMNKDDGYIGTNPYQYVIPGGNIMELESDTNCAIREFYEETMGSFFSINDIKKYLNCDNKIYNDKYNYYTFLVNNDISSESITTYNKIRSYLDGCLQYVNDGSGIMMQQIPCCPDGYIEKSEIKW